MPGELRIVYVSTQYDATVAFYRDGLGLPVLSSWNEGPEARGTEFQAGCGIIEIMAYAPNEGKEWQVFLSKPATHLNIAIEADDVDAWYQHILNQQLPIRNAIADFSWGHRGFTLLEPNGHLLYFYTPRT